MSTTTRRVLAILAVLALVIGVLVLAGATASDDTSETTVAAGDSSTTTSTQGDTTVPPTTTTTIVNPENTNTDEVSGNLLVSEVAAWDPTFNVGDLVLDSSLCTFFASESEAYAWLNAIRLGSDSDEEFTQILNERYRALRIDYWMSVPRAAAVNMMLFLETEKPWLRDLVDNVFGGGSWNIKRPRQTMVLVSEMLWTDVVAVPASFRTTGCNNSVGVDSEQFRQVYKAQNVVVSPDDADWVPTLVDVVLPSYINQMLMDMGSNVRIRQIILEDGSMGYEVGEPDKGGIIEIDRKVSVLVIISLGTDHVVAEAVFSTACGNPTLPEFTPPRKVETTTTTTAPTTTTTTTAPTTTTTTSSTTTTSTPTTTTTTTAPTTTTTQATTTTTEGSTTTTTAGTTTTTKGCDKADGCFPAAPASFGGGGSGFAWAAVAMLSLIGLAWRRRILWDRAMGYRPKGF